MKLKTLAIATAAVSFFFGLGLALIPETMISYYGRELSDTGIYVARLLGAAYIGFGVLTWSMRNSEVNPTSRSIFLALFVMDMIGAVVSLMGQVADPPVTNVLGWTTVAIYLILGSGWGILFFFRSTEPAIQGSSAS
jgi:hypothetical protein